MADEAAPAPAEAPAAPEAQAKPSGPVSIEGHHFAFI